MEQSIIHYISLSIGYTAILLAILAVVLVSSIAIFLLSSKSSILLSKMVPIILARRMLQKIKATGGLEAYSEYQLRAAAAKAIEEFETAENEARRLMLLKGLGLLTPNVEMLQAISSQLKIDEIRLLERGAIVEAAELRNRHITLDDLLSRVELMKGAL